MPQNVVSQFKRAFGAPIETDRSVATPTARNAIATSTRWEGMLVYVVSEGITYELKGGTDNTAWTPFGGGEIGIEGITFDPDTGLLAISVEVGPDITVDLSAYTVLWIDGFQVKKGVGNTNYTTIQAGDYVRGWDGDRDVAFKVDALPYTTESNRIYSTNNGPGF